MVTLGSKHGQLADDGEIFVRVSPDPLLTLQETGLRVVEGTVLAVGVVLDDRLVPRPELFLAVIENRLLDRVAARPVLEGQLEAARDFDHRAFHAGCRG
jgi:hypothetical protein